MRRRSLMTDSGRLYDSRLRFITVDDSPLMLDYAVDYSQDIIRLYYDPIGFLADDTNQGRIVTGDSCNIYKNGSAYYAYLNNNEVWSSTGYKVAPYRHKIEFNFKNNFVTIDDDGSRNLSNDTKDLSHKTPTFFFTSYNNQSHPTIKGAIYRINIQRGENWIFDIIPVRKGRKAYFYDRISGKLFKVTNPKNLGYTRNSSGTFVPSEDDISVDITGKYINTGIYIEDNDITRYKFEIDSINTDFGYMHNNLATGCWVGINSNRPWFGNWNKKGRKYTASIHQRIMIDYVNNKSQINGEGVVDFTFGDYRSKDNISNIPLCFGKVYDFYDNSWKDNEDERRLTYAKVWKDDVLILHLVPCEIPNKVLDLVSNNYFDLIDS